MAGVLNDFFKSFIRDNLGRREFWGDYSYLNDIGVESFDGSLEESYLNIQLAHLKILENSKLKEFPALNNFIVKSPEEFAQLGNLEDKVANGAYSGFVQGLNKMLWGNTVDNPTRVWKDKNDTGFNNPEEAQVALEEREIKREALIKDFQDFLEDLTTDQQARVELAEKYEKRVKDFTSSKKYSDEKWQMAEVGALKVSENIFEHVVGSGQIFDNMGKMLIQDLLMTDEAHYHTYAGTLNIEFKIDGKTVGGEVAHTAEELFNIIKKASGQYSIYIKDELSDFLEKAGIVAGQVKSGMDDQYLLNKSKRSQISLEEIGYNDPGLWELYNLQVPKNSTYGSPWYYKIPPNFKDSKLLEALANYALSKEIAKTAIKFNMVYFTKYGVSTASAYMKKVKQYIAFSPGVTKIGPEFMSKQRSYTFHSIG